LDFVSFATALASASEIEPVPNARWLDSEALNRAPSEASLADWRDPR